MSLRGWSGSLAVAAGVSAGAGAAQLGLGYGLGIFSWLPTVHGAGEAGWLASLAWTVWIAALSVMVGAFTADRAGMSTSDFTRGTRILWRTSLVLAASLGGLVVAALTSVQAQAAQRGDTYAPHLIVSGYAIAGVLLGLVAAGLVLSARAIAANVLATGGWLWLLATVSVIDSIVAGHELGLTQLGVWRLTDRGGYWHGIHLPGALLAGGTALLLGAVAAWPSARRGGHIVGVALSGAVGPAVVATAYLLAAPTLIEVSPQQLSAHLLAPYSVIFGLAGSVATALIARPRRVGAAATEFEPLPLHDELRSKPPTQAAMVEPVADEDATSAKATSARTAAQLG